MWLKLAWESVLGGRGEVSGARLVGCAVVNVLPFLC